MRSGVIYGRECSPVAEHNAATLAAAMVGHVLPAAGSLRLEVTTDEHGTWPHLSYTPKECRQETAPTAPGGLAVVDSMALRWGHFGDSHWHTLWALLAPSADAHEAGGDAAPPPPGVCSGSPDLRPV